MLTAVCLTLIVLSLLAFSIVSEARLYLDAFGEKNCISFFLFGLKVITVNISLIKGDGQIKLELSSKDKPIASLSIDDLKAGARENLMKALPNPFYNIDIVAIDAFAEYGGSDAFATAIISSALDKVFVGALLYILSTQRVKVMAHVRPNFDHRAINLRLSGIFCITMADIIYGIIFSKKGEKKNDIGK